MKERRKFNAPPCGRKRERKIEKGATVQEVRLGKSYYLPGLPFCLPYEKKSPKSKKEDQLPRIVGFTIE